jgi:serine phosphatase RsbU (regulator of sigma subunit)
MSIAVKLILASSVMLVLAVALITLVSVGKISEQASEQIKRQEAIGHGAFQRESALIAKATAQAVAYQVANNISTEVHDVLMASLVEHNEPGELSLGGERFAQPEILWLLAFETDVELDKGKSASTPMAPLKPSEILQVRTELLGAASVGPLAQGVVCSGTSAKELQVRWVCAAPIFYADRRVGTLWMGVSAAPLVREVASARARYLEREASYRRTVLFVAGGILVFSILLAALQGLSLARPITALTEQAARIAGGDLGSRVPTGRSDELGVLADKFNFMADQIGLLLIEQAKKATLEHEMSLARSVQQSMLPPHSLESFANLKVVGYCAPASSCGGDWWMYRKMSGGRMLIVVGDATGHGIHSAMIAATARGAVEALAALDERLLVPEQVLRAIDSAIRNVGEHHVLMTAFAAVLDSSSGILQYANAGQNFPYIVRCGAGRVLADAVILATSGNPLGDREIPLEIRSGSRELAPGDLFVCFTDGLVERANPVGALFGDRRLLRAMKSQSVENDDALVALRERVVTAVESYAEGEVAGDDVTFVLCQYDPPEASFLKSTGTG